MSSKRKNLSNETVCDEDESEEVVTNSDGSTDSEDNKEKPKIKKVKTSQGSIEPISEDNNEKTFQLSSRRRVTVRKWKSAILIDIREFYLDHAGIERPTKKGVSLSVDQWKKLIDQQEAIDDAISTIE